MKYRPKNTLAYFNAAPQVKLHNLSELPTAVFSASTLEYRKNCGHTSPNDDAVSFYTLNHCASIVRKLFTENEPLPPWAQEILQTYTDVMMSQGERMTHYILSIITREMRHLKSNSTATVWTKLSAQLGPTAVNYLKSLQTLNETGAVDSYMKTPPYMSIGQYVKTMAYAYYHGSWSSGYGGKAWGQVTDAIVSMLHGETSMEMMVDTGYTLAHNGGPIFNKGMMYGSYDSHFMTILDVQRSGQLPDLMRESNTFGVKKTPDAVRAVELILMNRPQELKGYVDWKLVDELRPQKDKDSYPSKYQKQVVAQKQPTSKKPVQPKAKPVVPQPLMFQGKKVKVTGTWQVFPHQEVTVFERTEQ